MEEVINQYKISKQKIPVPLILKILSQILQGLSYLHKTTLHCNLKPRNILFDEDGDAKISDFSVFGNKTVWSVAGTLPYIAPEVMNGDEMYNAKADIWALGKIIHEALDVFAKE